MTLAGQPATQDVAVDVQVDTPPVDPPPAPTPAQVYKAKRWVSYEVDIPVTYYRKELRWKLEEYELPIPDPGPQPPMQVLSDPCAQCPPAPASSSVNVDVDVPFMPTPQPPSPPQCLDGSCIRRVIGNRVGQGAQGARVNVDVDTRPRGLFWRFRR